jgi:hypothetical protein
MRGVAVALVGAALLGGLTGCSPGRNAVAAIGLDDQGRLIGAVTVCSGAVVEGALTTVVSGERQPDVSTWRRDTALREGMETWQLGRSTSGPWQSTGASLPDLAAKTEFRFGTVSEDGGPTSNWLEFRGRDLLRLAPGEVLVEHRPDGGRATLEILAVEELVATACPE